MCRCFEPGQSAGSDMYSHGNQGSFDGRPNETDIPNDDPAIIAAEPAIPSVEKVMIKQHSTTEYLPGMLHTESPPGLLPEFPSWSLLSLGKYSIYNPTQGAFICLYLCIRLLLLSYCIVKWKNL